MPEANCPEKIKNPAPLPAGLPHVAYVLLWYPLFTQPFIFREVENLRQVLPIKTYTLYGPNLRHCSREMIQEAIPTTRFGLKSSFAVFWALLNAIFTQPRKIWKLFKKTCCRRWGSFEIMGENLWGFCAGTLLAKYFREDGMDMIYAPWPRGAATAAEVASELGGLPFAIAARGDNLSPADPDLGDKFSGAVFIRANNAADGERIRKFDQGQAKDKTELVYNSLTLPQASEIKHVKADGPALRLLALGRFDVTKGFDQLLKACAILKKKDIPFHLTLAGGGGKFMGLGKLEHKLHALRKELRLEEEVGMPGLISHDELPRLLAEHDVFVAPCVIHPSGRRDGIPNTVIEAMAFSLPVIATSVNALPEVVRDGETGLLAPPGDPQALAEAIIWCSEHREKLAELGARGQILARSMFDPQLNARKLADVFIAAKKGKKCAA